MTYRIINTIVTFVFLLFIVGCANLQSTNSDNNKIEVSGTITLIFAPTPLAKAPNPPFDLTLVTKKKNDGIIQNHPIEDPGTISVTKNGRTKTVNKNFTLKLDPGYYDVLGFKVMAPSLGDKTFEIPSPGPYFEIGNQNSCVHLGRLMYSMLRLPSGTYKQAQLATRMIAKQRNRPFFVVYLPKGALVPIEFSVNVPLKEEQKQDALVSGYRHYIEKQKAGCDMKLFQY